MAVEVVAQLGVLGLGEGVAGQDGHQEPLVGEGGGADFEGGGLALDGVPVARRLEVETFVCGVPEDPVRRIRHHHAVAVEVGRVVEEVAFADGLLAEQAAGDAGPFSI